MPPPILEYFVQEMRLPSRSVSQRVDRRTPRVMKGASGRLTATLGAAALVINQAFVPEISNQT